jgi:hypothetical protein
MAADPWALLREARKTVWEWLEMSVPIDMDVLDRIDAALVQHEADEKHRQGYGDRLIALAQAEERKQHFQQGYSDAILDGLKREDALKRADEYAEEKMLGWK